MNVKEWVIGWFEKKTTMNAQDIINNFNENYLELNVIDSFGFLELLSNIEEEFGISFLEEDYEDEKILTIKGMVTIIENKLG